MEAVSVVTWPRVVGLSLVAVNPVMGWSTPTVKVYTRVSAAFVAVTVAVYRPVSA